MVRTLGLGVLIVAALLAAQRLLAPFDLQVASRFDGEDVIPVMERCGQAAAIILDPETELATLGANFGSDCTRAARTRALEAGGAVLVGAVIGWVTLVRGLRRVTPMSESLRPLPQMTGEVEGRHRGSPRSG